MRQFKSQFHAGTDKDIIVINCYVPSAKRKKGMTSEQKKAAKKWAKEVIQDVKRFLSDVAG